MNRLKDLSISKLIENDQKINIYNFEKGNPPENIIILPNESLHFLDKSIEREEII